MKLDDVPTPTVSVVLPTYRRPDLLERAVLSVGRQTWGDWELLVVDDNGYGTAEQRATERGLRRLGADPRVAYLPQVRNAGACAARNAGIRAARGEYVAFLDDDDVWYPTKLALQVSRFGSVGPEVAAIYGGLRYVHDTGPTQTVLPNGRAHEWRALLKRNGIGTISVVMVRRDALIAIGGFDEELPAKQDIDLYIRLAQRFAFDWVGEALLDKHQHGGEAIGRDQGRIARANELFYEKHATLFVSDPEVHHYRLRSFGHEMLRAGRMREARRLLLKAWWLRPSDVVTLGLALLMSRPLLAAYRGCRRTLRSAASASPPRGA